MVYDDCMDPGPYPVSRLRRLRQSAVLRRAVADVVLTPDQLICPLFVTGEKEAKPVASMPGISQWPVQEALGMIRTLSDRGLFQFLLFGVTPAEKKDARGTFVRSPEAPVNRLLAEVREAGLKVVMYADLCLCEYTNHGHCGLLHAPTEKLGSGGDESVKVDNDATLGQYALAAVMLAKAGADVVAPSGMMDGQVGVIRSALDDAGYHDVAILAYSVKYASSFYGPFRDAGQGGMKFGDRRGYQMDYRRSREWRSEIQADLAQGADMLMVKPAGAYLDIVRHVRETVNVPLVGYQVSGEYAMLHAAAQQGWVDLKQGALETTYAIRRAGADLVISYFAPQLLDWLREEK